MSRNAGAGDAGSSGADRFARFVALLSARLDGGHARGADLAAELFMSRSVLDRIVTAVAGEPAGKLRRRLMLERAAYRLRMTDSSVLDTAVEAGYSSNEAFTRAFQRAYGVPPARWRASSAPVLLPAPGGVHFYPPGGIRLPAGRRGRPVNFTAELVDQHVWLLARLLDSAETLTAEQLDAPIEISVQGIDTSPTIRSLLSRLVGQLDMWNAAMASRPYDFGSEWHESIEDMRMRLAGGGAGFAAFVRQGAEQDRLDETFVDATGETPFLFTAAGMMAHVLIYAGYRRTLVCGALASAGAPDVDDDPLNWFTP